MQVVRRVFQRPSVKISLVILLILILGSVFAPLLTPYSYEEMNIADRFSGPTLKHLLGTDDLGRDLLTRLLYGGRFSLQIGVWSTLISAVIGVAIGSIAGYYGGAVDNIIMRIVDILQSIPGLLFAIIISATLGSGFGNTVLALAVTGIWPYIRMMRAQILSVRKMDYLELFLVIK